MQGVFAFRKKEESNFNLALNEIDESFAPDLNSMTAPDHQLLARNKKEAKEIFKKYYQDKRTPSLPAVDEEVIEAVEGAIRFYWTELAKDSKKLKQQLVADTELILTHYYRLLLFLADLYEVEVKLHKTAFNEFQSLKVLVEDDQFQAEVAKRDLVWEKENSLIRKIYKEGIAVDEKFIEFLNQPKKTIEDEVEILRHITKNLIYKNEFVNELLEEEDTQWAENGEIAISLVLKSIKRLKEGTFTHFMLSENWEEDQEFFLELFSASIEPNVELKDKIAKGLKNWQLDRVALTDQIILEMALLEMINFPNIPNKVTINEFIELSKKYSTPKSKQFVNGVLDVLSHQLVADGTIKKSGRGLMDNK